MRQRRSRRRASGEPRQRRVRAARAAHPASTDGPAIAIRSSDDRESAERPERMADRTAGVPPGVRILSHEIIERAAALGHIAPRMTRVPGGVAGTCFAPVGDMRSLDRVLLVTATTALSLAVASPGATTRADSRVPLTGGVHRYVTVEGDTWPLLEARFGVDARTLITDNGLTAGRPLPAGLELRVDNRHIVPEALER